MMKQSLLKGKIQNFNVQSEKLVGLIYSYIPTGLRLGWGDIYKVTRSKIDCINFGSLACHRRGNWEIQVLKSYLCLFYIYLSMNITVSD